MSVQVSSIPSAPAQHAPPDRASDLRSAVLDRLSARIRAEKADSGRDVDDKRRDEIAEELLAEELEAIARAELAAGRPMPTAETEAVWAKHVRDQLSGLQGLKPYLELDDVENIDILGYDKVFLRLTGNRRERGKWPVAASDADLITLVQTLASRSGESEREFSRGNPIVDVQLPDGSRMSAVAWVSRRPNISIRVHRHRVVSMAAMVGMGVLSEELSAFLSAAVRARLNILVAGGPGTGKTTLLRALATQIPPEEGLTTIEDSRELDLGADEELHPQVKEWQSRPANVEDEGEITLAGLCRAALRQAPDRVIVGEVRGEEVVQMFKVMSQGSDGSMATIHASDSREVFTKLAAYAAEGPNGLRLSEANQYAASAINLIVQLDYTDDRVTRIVSSVREVVGADGDQLVTNEVFAPDSSGRAASTGALSDKLARRLQTAGLDPAVLMGPTYGTGFPKTTPPRTW